LAPFFYIIFEVNYTTMVRQRKRFVELEHVLTKLPGTEVKLEYRKPTWKFGTLNYGEVVENWQNSSDNDRWDIFAPGYIAALETGKYTCTAIIGVLLLENKNHKIGVKIDCPGFCTQRSEQEIKRFVEEYCRRMKLNGSWCTL
jgi:hypothetical protein